MTFVTQFKPAGTRSFRLASSKLFGEFGGNAQNWKKDSLRFLEARRGCSFVQADQAGAEALVVAYDAPPGRFRRLFENSIKPHTYMAMHLFADRFLADHDRNDYWLAEPSDIKKLPDWPALKEVINNSGVPYDLGKRIIHASNYRMGPRTFAFNTLKQTEGKLVLTIKQCEEYLAMFRIIFPEIVEWQNEIEQRVMRDRKLVNLFGYPRAFERNITDEYIREAISWIPQSTVGTITNIACSRFQYKYGEKRKQWRLLNNKHDSFMVECPDADIADVSSIMVDLLAVRLKGRDTEYTMRSEVQVGKNWGKYNENYNPEGMR